jgi:hypothetical protein
LRKHAIGVLGDRTDELGTDRRECGAVQTFDRFTVTVPDHQGGG